MIYVPPAQLDCCWAWVSRGIVHATRRGGGTHTPEQVREMIETGGALLFVSNRGFVVLQVSADGDGYTLFVFSIWGPGKLAEVESYMYDWLRRVRDDLGCKKLIRFESTRKGWARRPGVRLAKYIYELE